MQDSEEWPMPVDALELEEEQAKIAMKLAIIKSKMRNVNREKIKVQWCVMEKYLTNPPLQHSRTHNDDMELKQELEAFIKGGNQSLVYMKRGRDAQLN
jgi:hypothetical protein